MRSLSMPKIGLSRKPDDAMAGSPYQFESSHSRESSGASTSSTPLTPTFSNRSHGLWQNSNSSFGTTPESPVNLTKSPLHDLPEDPEEREDGSFDIVRQQQDPEYQDDDEPLCICDTPFCVHQSGHGSRSSVVSPNPEWLPGDDYDLSAQHSLNIPPQKERSSDSLASRMSRRFPSISKRWKEQPAKPTTMPSVRSAPASRAPSLRLSGVKHAFGTHSESRTPPFTPVESVYRESSSTRTSRIPSAPIDIQAVEVEDPISHRDYASTPLLPPMVESTLESHRSQVHSPLQSPTIAEGDGTFTPRMTPSLAGMPTPPLSTKASIASFRRFGPEQCASTSDIPTMPLSDDNDPWAARLGHANFHITPEPYFPDHCDTASCKRLLDDWEAARMDYMRQATPISEHYGPTSRTFKLAERKWAEIEAVWRANHELANAQAGVSSRSPVYQSLAEAAPLPKMPSLNDAQQSAKFPKIDDSEIVGPMVQYARIQRQPSRRPSFLRLFTDPASLLGRSAFSVRR